MTMPQKKTVKIPLRLSSCKMKQICYFSKHLTSVECFNYINFQEIHVSTWSTNHVWSYQRRSRNHQNWHVSSRARTVCVFPDEVNFFNNVQLTYVIASETRFFFYTIKGHLPSLKEVYRLYLIGHTFRTFKLYLVSGFIQIKRNRTLV